MSKNIKTYSVWLDVIRGLAAMVVFLGHARVVLIGSVVGAMGTAGADIAAKTVVNGKQPELSSFGHIAVMVFFVLSGYLVGGGAVKALRQNRWSGSNYAIARLSRLWTGLIPILLIGYVLDHVGLAMAGPRSIYSGPLGQEMVFDTLSDQIGIFNLILNALFLQTIFVKTFGTNSPLWSLAYEFWFYAAFPFLMFLVRPESRVLRRVGCAIALMLIGILVGPRICFYFFFWLLGVGIELAPKKLSQRTALILSIGGSFLFVALCVAILKAKQHIFVSDTIESIGFTLLIYCIVHLQAERPRDRLAWAASALAAVSYTLYVAHAPLIAFISSLLMPVWRPWPVNAIGLAKFMATSAVVFGLVLLLWWLFERNTPTTRRWMEKLYRRLADLRSSASSV